MDKAKDIRDLDWSFLDAAAEGMDGDGGMEDAALKEELWKKIVHKSQEGVDMSAGVVMCNAAIFTLETVSEQLVKAQRQMATLVMSGMPPEMVDGATVEMTRRLMFMMTRVLIYMDRLGYTVFPDMVIDHTLDKRGGGR